MTTSTPVCIDVWSDYVCPFCYLELPFLQRLQQTYGASLQIRWRAFELRPEPNPTLDPKGEYLRTTWERSVYPMADQRSMALKLPPVQPRSRKALEAAAYAGTQGRFDAMHEAIFKAFFEHGRDIGEPAVLLELGESAGLERQALSHALQTDAHLKEVLADQELAHQLGISGVPIMVFRRTSATPWEHAVALRGAVPYEQMRTALDRMLQDPAVSGPG